MRRIEVDSKMLMCSPKHYRTPVNHLITRQPIEIDSNLAASQYLELLELLDSKVSVQLMSIAGQAEPETVFTGEHFFLLSRTQALLNSHQDETLKTRIFQWMLKEGIEPLDIQAQVRPRNLVWAGQTLLVGITDAQDEILAQALKHIMPGAVLQIPIPKQNGLHLEHTVQYLTEGVLMVGEGLISPEGVSKLRDHFDTLIPLTMREIQAYSAEAVIAGDLFISQYLSPATKLILKRLGFTVAQPDLSEFIRTGRGPSALVTELRAIHR